MISATYLLDLHLVMTKEGKMSNYVSTTKYVAIQVKSSLLQYCFNIKNSSLEVSLLDFILRKLNELKGSQETPYHSLVSLKL